MMLSVILVAGGRGSRMQKPIPKQFLPLKGKAVALHSLEVLQGCPEVSEVVVVCAPEYRSLFADYNVRFALPGVERQDSVFNGLAEVEAGAEWVMVHDSARPFISSQLIQSLLEAGKKSGAAALAMPVKNTLKEIDSDAQVRQTIDRSRIWEIQTPQLLRKKVLEEGFAYARMHQAHVTDDVSLAELIGHPVQLVLGSYQNIKITTAEDWAFAEWLVQNS